MAREDFPYQEAFSRNLGLVSEEEQTVLQQSTAAVAGMGGMGGAHVLTLARLGIGRFIMADFDSFELVNFNRQVGANVKTVGLPKLEVMAERIREINPQVELILFDRAVTLENADQFLQQADVVLDGLDFFCFEHRRHLFNAARQVGLHVVSTGPIGFSAIMQIFSPNGMSFDRYFAVREGMTREEKLLSFLVGIAPGGTHLAYVNTDRINLEGGAGPSVGLAVQMAAGLAAGQVVKILLNRGPVPAVPYYFQVDAYTLQCKKGKVWWGNRNLIQRLKLWYVKRLLESQSAQEEN